MNTNPFLLKTFNERLAWFLTYLYEHGGSEYKGSDYTSFGSYPIPGASSPEEFDRLVEALVGKGWVSCFINPTIGVTTNPQFGPNKYYQNLKLTVAGITEAEKNLPQIPMIGLVSQDIKTGDAAVDNQINHAKKLFFNQPYNKVNMRSACETLCFVLEPLRDSLKPTFTDADVNTFFELVNKFDIRHNKDSTMKLMHEEQLEWVFYTLLNTINTYTKLKARLAV